MFAPLCKDFLFISGVGSLRSLNFVLIWPSLNRDGFFCGNCSGSCGGNCFVQGFEVLHKVFTVGAMPDMRCGAYYAFEILQTMVFRREDINRQCELSVYLKI